MIHSRSDYNRIQDPASEPGIYRLMGKLADAYEKGGMSWDGVHEALSSFFGIGEEENRQAIAEARAFAARAELPEGSTPIGDEPVFLLRAQDRVAPRTVEGWADRAAQTGARADITRLAASHARVMRAWQRLNSCKVPDLPEGTGA